MASKKSKKYRSTLNLPSTPFEMRADLLRSQEKTLRRWQAQSIYQAIREERRDARPFVIHDGPPYAAGDIHVGIGMNKIVKDLVAKFQAMNERRISFVPGWDCHGLPIEQKAIRRLAEEGGSASQMEVRKLCERQALGYLLEQKDLFQKLGIFADWERPYLTMAASYEAAVLTVLRKAVEKGYVTRDMRPLPWCTACGTSLAESELEYRTVDGPSIWVHFEGGEELAARVAAPAGRPCSLVVWTTTPWSLPGNVAVAVHPEFDYCVLQVLDSQGVERIVVTAEARREPTLAAIGAREPHELGRLTGAALAGARVVHPILDRQVPVVLADYIDDESGTGIVHIAPAHGLEDFRIARQNGLEIVNPIADDGTFTEEAGPLEEMGLTEAAEEVLAALRTRRALAGLDTIRHEYPHCDRCETQVISRATEQWFLKLDHRERGAKETLRSRALLEVEVTSWVPDSARRRSRSMIASRSEWCISRQRSWGVPLPALLCRGCGRLVLAVEVIDHVCELVAEKGSNVWFESPGSELTPPGFGCPHCQGGEFDKGSDILDVWFESGASWLPVLVADHRSRFPADLCVEGSDQHRGWFQVSLFLSMIGAGTAPYQKVLTHGFVVRKEGRESRQIKRFRGEELTLGKTLETVPSDLVRLFFASVDVTHDVEVALEDFTHVEPVYRAIRNSFRFLLGNLDDFVPREHSVHTLDLEPLDLWMLGETHRLVAEVTRDYVAFRFHAVVRRIHSFCNEDLSKLYFDILKDRLYAELPDAGRRRSAQTVLHSILVALVKLLAPILPYTAEEVWDLTPGHGGSSSVHLSRWPKADDKLLHTRDGRDARTTFARFARLRKSVKPILEAAREAGEIGGDGDATVRLHFEDGLKEFLGVASRDDLRDFLRVAEVGEASSADGLAPASELDGASLAIEPSEDPVCDRCWRRESSRGSQPGYPDLCERCAAVLLALSEPPPPSPTVQPPIEPGDRPADLARFMRQRGLRKLALLNEDGRMVPYALHPSSQQVRPLRELEPLAEYVNGSNDFRGHAAILMGIGEHTNVLFGIGIHRLDYGTPLGGTRETAYPEIRSILDNLLRLSWGMSVKNAVAELPHAGGKSIIDPCGWDVNIHREFRREVYRDFGQFTASLFGRYICAEDVGNTTADTREMLYACRHVMCLSQGVGGSGNPSRFTSLAAWAAAKAGWKFVGGSTSFDGLTVALQGAGNVGRNLVAILAEADRGISRLILADRNPEQIQVIRNILLKKGLEDRLEIVSSLDPMRAKGGAYVERRDEKGKEYLLYAPCDILVTAAVGNVIGPHNVDRLRCKLIVPIANNVYSDNDEISEALFERGIVDVVENNVNWGGAMAAASEISGYDESNVALACIEAFDKTLTLLERAKKQGKPPWFIVRDLAKKRIEEEVHPAVAAERQYRFIGDISREFGRWIKTRWLPNLVDVPPDQFPRFALASADFLNEEKKGRGGFK